MAEETGFFRFDTNLGAIVSEIEQGMARINRATSRAGSVQQTNIDIEGLSGFFANARQGVEGMQREMRGLIQQVGNRQITPEEFRASARNLVHGTMTGMQESLRQEFRNIPQSTLRSLDFSQMMRQVVNDVYGAAAETLHTYRPEANGLLRGVGLRRPGQLMDSLAARPFGAGPGDPIGYLQYQQFLEGLVQQSPGGRSKVVGGIAERLGVERDLERLRQQLVMRDKDGNIVGVRKTSTKSDLQELLADERAGISVNREYERTNERVAASLNQASAAAHTFDQRLEALRLQQRALRGEFGERLPSGSYLSDTGRAYVPGMGGLVVGDANQTAKVREEVDKLAESKAKLATEEEHYQRIMTEGRQVGGSNIYRTPDGSFFRDLGGGRATQLEGLEYTRAFHRYNTELDQLAVSTERLARTREQQAIREVRNNSGFTGGFLSRFHRNEMSPIVALGQQVGSAAAFSAAYGSLFALQGGIRDTIAEFQDYQDSLTDLEVATRNADSVTNTWVNDLSELSRLSGSNVGAAMDAAARGVRAFTDPLRDSQQVIHETGDATAEAATKLALVANKDLRDATGDIVAVGSAYQLQGAQLNEIVDAVANAKRNLGGDPSQIAQGLALIAGAAQEAGYSMTEAASVIGVVQAQTDQSGQAIATRLSRVFQIISGSTGKALAAEIGVDPNQSVKRQLEEYSRIFTDPETSKAKQDRILSALGGTANRREVLAVLRNGDRLARSYADAFKNAGAGTAEFERKTRNLVGTLKKLTSDIKNIQVDLARTGLFTPFGLLVKTLEPALHGLDLMIKLVDRLTGQNEAVQRLGFSLLDVAIAAKAIGAIQAKRALFQAASSTAAGVDVAGEVAAAQLAAMRAGATKAEVAAIGVATRERLAAEEAMDAAIIGSAERRAAAETAGASAAASGGIKAGLASMWSFLKKPTSLIGLGLLAGGFGISMIHDQQTAANAFRRDATQSALGAYSKSDGSSEALAATAGTLNSLYGKVKNSASQGANQVQAAATKLLHTRSQEVLALAKLTQAEEQRAAAANKVTAFGSGAIETTTELAKGMATIAAGGGTALTQIRALRQALSTPPTPGKEIFRPQRTANDVRDALMQSLNASVPDTVQGYRFDVTDKPWNPSSGLPVPATVPSQNKAGGVMPYSYLNKQEAEQAILANNTDKQIDAIVKQKIRELGLQGKTNITADQKRRLLKATIDSLDFSQFTTASKEIIDAWYKNALKKLRMPVAAGGVDPSLLNSKHRTIGQVESILNGSEGEDGTKYVGFAKAMQDALGAIPKSDDGTMKIAELRAQVTFLQGLKRSLGGERDANLDLLLANTVHDFRAAEVEQAEALRTAAEAHAKNNKQLREIRLRLAKVSIRKAGNDIPLLISIMQNLDRRTIQALLDYQRTAITLVEQARLHTLSLIHAAQQVLESGNLAAGTHGGDYLMHGQATDNADAVDKADRQAKRIKGMKKHLDAMEQAYSQSTVTDATAEVPGGSGGSGQSAAEKALEKARAHAALVAAKASAQAARKGGSLAQARSQIVAAAASMEAEKRGTTEWYNALASWYSARQSLADAILQYRYTLDQLHGDITNPVENARDNLRNARRTLATHRAQGRGADVLASDRLAVRQAETQLESERFNQRLQDVQTAEQLGRISHRKYIEYLDHEHDRLSRIKHRTRQQQDELNQIDQAMKDAVTQMQGQFNLGDIDVRGLVYSSRRYAAEVKAGRASMQVSHSASVNQTVTIQIDGADVGKVRKIIDEYVGGSATVRTTKPRRG